MLIQAEVLCKWTNDTRRLLLGDFDTICNSPSHIYHNALPFSPSSSWLHEHYPAELLQVVRVIKGPAEWGKCFRTVLLDSHTSDLSYCNNTIAVGSINGVITIFDAIVGNWIITLLGHTDEVNTLTFSSGGKSLVSGSDDKTVKLWDMQTGGIIRTFGHTGVVWAVSISSDFTTIASGSSYGLINLWDSQTGECYCIIRQWHLVCCIGFSPTDPQHLISVCNNKVWKWDINGHKAGPTLNGSYAAFSPDGTLLIVYYKTALTVQNFNSGAIVAEFHMGTNNPRHCCFSPDNKLIAVATGEIAYIWDISSSNPCLIETLAGHTEKITSLAFSSPSSLISVSHDKSVKFWKISTPSIDPVLANPKSTSPTSARTRVIALQPKDGITITSDSYGVVKTWDISTGLCKGSFQTPARDYKQDAQLINGRLILVWYADKINIWDVDKEKLLFAVKSNTQRLDSLKISGNGYRVFSLGESSIQAWSVQTGEFISRVEINYSSEIGSLIVDGSRVWAHYTGSRYEGWDFGTPGSLPIQLLDMPPVGPHPNCVWDTGFSEIKDKATGKVIVPKRYGRLVNMQQNGQYLVACFNPAEILILDLSHVLLK